MKVYVYKRCSTCRDALKFLNNRGIDYEEVEITEKTPTVKELEKMLKFQGNLKKLFNTSGLVYKSLGLKDKFDTLTKEEAFKLLQSDGKLVKRPFLISDTKGLVGFKEEEWNSL